MLVTTKMAWLQDQLRMDANDIWENNKEKEELEKRADATDEPYSERKTTVLLGLEYSKRIHQCFILDVVDVKARKMVISDGEHFIYCTVCPFAYKYLLSNKYSVSYEYLNMKNSRHKQISEMSCKNEHSESNAGTDNSKLAVDTDKPAASFFGRYNSKGFIKKTIVRNEDPLMWHDTAAFSFKGSILQITDCFFTLSPSNKIELYIKECAILGPGSMRDTPKSINDSVKLILADDEKIRMNMSQISSIVAANWYKMLSECFFEDYDYKTENHYRMEKLVGEIKRGIAIEKLVKLCGKKTSDNNKSTKGLFCAPEIIKTTLAKNDKEEAVDCKEYKNFCVMIQQKINNLKITQAVDENSDKYSATEICNECQTEENCDAIHEQNSVQESENLQFEEKIIRTKISSMKKSRVPLMSLQNNMCKNELLESARIKEFIVNIFTEKEADLIAKDDERASTQGHYLADVAFGNEKESANKVETIEDHLNNSVEENDKKEIPEIEHEQQILETELQQEKEALLIQDAVPLKDEDELLKEEAVLSKDEVLLGDEELQPVLENLLQTECHSGSLSDEKIDEDQADSPKDIKSESICAVKTKKAKTHKSGAGEVIGVKNAKEKLMANRYESSEFRDDLSDDSSHEANNSHIHEFSKEISYNKMGVFVTADKTRPIELNQFMAMAEIIAASDEAKSVSTSRQDSFIECDSIHGDQGIERVIQKEVILLNADSVECTEVSSLPKSEKSFMVRGDPPKSSGIEFKEANTSSEDDLVVFKKNKVSKAADSARKRRTLSLEKFEQIKKIKTNEKIRQIENARTIVMMSKLKKRKIEKSKNHGALGMPAASDNAVSPVRQLNVKTQFNGLQFKIDLRNSPSHHRRDSLAKPSAETATKLTLKDTALSGEAFIRASALDSQRNFKIGQARAMEASPVIFKNKDDGPAPLSKAGFKIICRESTDAHHLKHSNEALQVCKIVLKKK
ncbi:hypothetical protein ENBRE01_1000 [Enteropsectra breve]|nr:hypothetical protein ENBRE01_1000 [Enteropsectra breve]